jgi:hypothetical protein
LTRKSSAKWRRPARFVLKVSSARTAAAEAKRQRSCNSPTAQLKRAQSLLRVLPNLLNFPGHFRE